MNEPLSVVNLSSYGNISIHLKELIDKKGITRYRLAELVDTRLKWWKSAALEL